MNEILRNISKNVPRKCLMFIITPGEHKNQYSCIQLLENTSLKNLKCVNFKNIMLCYSTTSTASENDQQQTQVNLSVCRMWNLSDNEH
jgi:hypothetical protein